MFAHDECEIRGSPDFSCTRMCKRKSKTGTCNNPDCKYAHSRKELRKKTDVLNEYDALHLQWLESEEAQQNIPFTVGPIEVDAMSVPSVGYPESQATGEIPGVVADVADGDVQAEEVADTKASDNSKPLCGGLARALLDQLSQLRGSREPGASRPQSGMTKMASKKPGFCQIQDKLKGFQDGTTYAGIEQRNRTSISGSMTPISEYSTTAADSSSSQGNCLETMIGTPFRVNSQDEEPTLRKLVVKNTFLQVEDAPEPCLRRVHSALF